MIGPGGKPVIAALGVLEGKSQALAKDSPLAVEAWFKQPLRGSRTRRICS